MKSNYHLVEKQAHLLNSQVQHWIPPVPFGLFGHNDLMSLFFYLSPFFNRKSDLPPLFWVVYFFVWKGSECHKLPFLVVCNLRWKTHWVAHRLLTSCHKHTFRVLYFYVTNWNCTLYLSLALKNDFLYIFLVCQCLGVFFLFVLRNHFDILQFSAFSITFVELKFDFSVPEITFLQWPCNVVIWKEIKPYAVPAVVYLRHLTAMMGVRATSIIPSHNIN